MLWGSGLAIMTRLLLTAGAVLLAYIACNLIQEVHSWPRMCTSSDEMRIAIAASRPIWS